MATVKQLHNERYGDYFEVTNKNGVTLLLSPFGARALELVLPLAEGPRNVLVGFDTIEGHKGKYFNASIGPVAGRIAKAQFELEGKVYQTEANQKGNTLHGGFHGFDLETWTGTPFEKEGASGVVFTLERNDGDYGFPGNLKVEAIYTLTDEDEYKFGFTATTDQATLFNPTNHGYYNLTGSPSNPIDEHRLEVHASKVAETRDDVTTTGEFLPVSGTKFDFFTEKTIGDTMLDDPFVLDKDQEQALVLTAPDGKVALTLTTTEPAVVIYTTGESEVGYEMNGGPMTLHGSVAIEPQKIPGTESYPQFGSITLTPDKPYFAESQFKLTYK